MEIAESSSPIGIEVVERNVPEETFPSPGTRDQLLLVELDDD